MQSTFPTCGVVVVAAGRGERFGANTPKQFLTLGQRPLFAHSMAVFDALDWVSRIVLVVPTDGMPEAARDALKAFRHEIACVTGGPRRQDSVANGLAALAAPFDVALVHDAARPFPDPKAVGRLAELTMQAGGGLLASPATDTVKRADARGRVAETLDRNGIWLAQTPQAIRADLVSRAIADLRDPALEVTDEAALLERWGVPVALVDGGACNFKVTRPADLRLAEAIVTSDKANAASPAME